MSVIALACSEPNDGVDASIVVGARDAVVDRNKAMMDATVNVNDSATDADIPTRDAHVDAMFPMNDAVVPDAAIPEPPSNAYVMVGTRAELLAALTAAKVGTVVYVTDGSSINLTGDEGIVVPAQVTLMGGGDVGGVGGPLLYTTELDTVPLFTAGGEGVRFTGLRIRGPDTEIGTSSYGKPFSRGIHAIRANNLQVDHCEIWGWAHAAIYIDRTRRAYVHHNSIHHNRRYGLGYGMTLVRESDVLVERNTFDYNRHAIAGTGRPGISYEARYNLTKANRNGHAFDMHGEDEADNNGSPYAGERLDIHHNTFLGSALAIMIRGRPKVGAYINDNCFSQSKGAGTAIVQRYFFGNVFENANQYSVANGDCHSDAAPGRAVRSDVNGDGMADLVTLFRGSAYTHLGSQTQKLTTMPPVFRHTMNTALFDGVGHLVIDVADVTGDLRSDLITASSDGNVYVYPGTVLSAFGSSVSSFAGSYQATKGNQYAFDPIAVADVNGDGYADLVSHYQSSIWTHPGNANGSFSSAKKVFSGTFAFARAGGIGHYPVDVADVTGDGRADLVTIHSDGNAYLFPGQDGWLFGSAVDSFSGTAHLAFLDGSGFEPVGLADVTGDGRADLIMGHTNGTVYVYPGGADGHFGSSAKSFSGTLKTATFGGDGHEMIASLDVTGDGHADLITATKDGHVYVYRGNPDGTFSNGVSSFAGSFQTSRFNSTGHEALSEKSLTRRRGCTASGCQ